MLVKLQFGFPVSGNAKSGPHRGGPLFLHVPWFSLGKKKSCGRQPLYVQKGGVDTHPTHSGTPDANSVWEEKCSGSKQGLDMLLALLLFRDVSPTNSQCSMHFPLAQGNRPLYVPFASMCLRIFVLSSFWF